jgi:hypothetical protein
MAADARMRGKGRKKNDNNSRRITMSRLTALALTAALAVGGISTAVQAAPRGHGHHGGGHARSFGGHGFNHGFRYRPYYRPHVYYGYSSCYRWRRVWTPYGWVLRRVNICYPRYRYWRYY